MSELGSLSPSVWGHSGWKFLFAIASVYSPDWAPPETRQRYYTYFNSLKSVLPCEKCRRHYNEYFNNKPLPFYLENRETLFHWLLGLHNKSNPDTMLLSREEAVKYYLKKNNSIEYPREKMIKSAPITRPDHPRLALTKQHSKCSNCRDK